MSVRTPTFEVGAYAFRQPGKFMDSRVGFETTVYLTSLIYSPPPSPLGTPADKIPFKGRKINMVAHGRIELPILG